MKSEFGQDAEVLNAKVFFRALFNAREVMFDGRERLQVLDAFARDGACTARTVHGHYGTVVEAWELDPKHEDELKKIRLSKIRIGCSYGLAKKARHERKRFDLLVIDTPQGQHTDALGDVKTEHFDFLLDNIRLLGDGGVVALYVNQKPYDARVLGNHGMDEYGHDHDKWMAFRRVFYGHHEPTVPMVLQAYMSSLEREGYVVESTLMTPCLSDVPNYPSYGFRLGLKVRRAT
jgi:hypothetical protein